MKDLIIIGGGPAGIAAGVYAARKRLTTTLIAEEIGGQSTVSEGIENWIGTTKISGADLAKSLKAHIEAVKADVVDVVEGDRVEKLERIEGGYRAMTASGKTFDGCAVLIASGAARRKLDIPGADLFENKGVTYCASCDGPLFSDMDVAVIGGGNAGFETAAQLLAYTKSVTLIHRHNDFKADAVTVEKVLAHPNMKVIRHAEPVSVKGETFVTGLEVRSKDTGEVTEIPVQGVFVEVGVIPNTGFAKDLAAMDPVGHIKVDPRTQRVIAASEPSNIAGDARRGMPSEGAVREGTVTEVGGTHNEADAVILDGVWAAGDATDELYHQNNIAAGDAVKALEDIYLWLKRR